ncbi:DUF1972 domain-containing protein [Aeromonas hydrophila]|uniref:DUF1972 domain-containing protein n=1 Tax=Aeromonas TaxID=642 RepID=UPI001B3A5694|nr:DUF1972 domain-containing protein [Aeromonas hydrophila]MBQ4677639.1 DUF1972 domain-containing protein [Aeromonas hydrophila]MBW3816243.1 DUF1972 domain-containing protein [Aeromonas hydrophila]MCF7676598.1 DUF1972 domain-containing protein [Aeromonas hydrophila]MCF7773322.1 DUF1972 domain-containing protein [Aeromonas hydrophila]
MKNIAVIGTVGIPACYGGFESLVQNLIDYQSNDIKYHVFCSAKSYDDKYENYKEASLSYLSIKANGVSSILYDILSLIICLKKKPDVTLILGVSGCLFLPIYRLFSSSRIVTNIDGLEWRRDKWGWLTKKFLKFSEKLAVRFSDVVVSDNQGIADYVMDEYGVVSDVIAYGGDHALQVGHQEKNVKDDFYLSLCRIEPENNIELILSAFSKSREKLCFIGNWEASEYGRALKSRFSHYENIEIVDPIYDISVLYKMRRQCKGYVHGHSAGGTNPSLVEAMQFGMPIYAYDCIFNRYTTENKGLYFSDEASLLNQINAELNMAKFGDAMKDIAFKKYQWINVASEYERLFLD